MTSFQTNSVLALLIGLLFVTAVVSEPAVAQDAEDVKWRQTVEIITPVESGEVTGAFLDSLVNVVERNNLQIKRSPEDENPRSFEAIESEILNEGLDFTSANRVFITYRFEADRRGLHSTIEELYFIYRPEAGMGSDMDTSIMAVDGTDPVIQEMLRNSGMQLRTNEVAFEPFHDKLLFHNLDESSLVALGGDIIRDEQEAERERLRVLRTVRGFLY